MKRTMHRSSLKQKTVKEHTDARRNSLKRSHGFVGSVTTVLRLQSVGGVTRSLVCVGVRSGLEAFTRTHVRERERAGRNHLCERRFCTGQAWLVCEQASHRVREVAARARARRSGSFERFAFVYIPCTCTCVQTCLYVCTRSTRYGGIRGEEGNT